MSKTITTDKNFQKKPEENFDQYCHRICMMKSSIPGATWTTIANIINANTGKNFSGDKYRKQERKYTTTGTNLNFLDRVQDENTEQPAPTYFDGEDSYTPEQVRVNFEKNETTSYKEIALTDEQIKDPKALLKAHGFDPASWYIKTANNVKTRRTTVDGGEINYYASRVLVRPRDLKDLDFEDVDEYFRTYFPQGERHIVVNEKCYDPNGEEFLEICLQDLHIGLLSYGEETGADYDMAIAIENVQNCINDIYQRCQGRKFKRIVLALLGDILHVDNLIGTTTRGTRQDIDSRPSKMFSETLDLLIETIEKLGVIAPVEVINVVGNHDSFASYMLAKSLEKAFRNEKNVIFHNDPNPRKWLRYNQVLLGYAHGNQKRSSCSSWLANECPEWSMAKYREIHMGHYHSLHTLHETEDEQYGVIVRYLPALCGSSAWEHESGYPKTQKGVMSFVWNESKGLREIWCSNV